MRLSLRQEGVVPPQPIPSVPPQGVRLLRLGGLLQGLSPGSRRCLVTISVENGAVRVVAFKGRQVLAWWTVGLGEGSGPGGQDGSPQDKGHAARPRNLLKELGVPAGRIVTDLPFTVPLMRHLHLPNIGRRYLEQVVLSEVVGTIPFSREEVDIAWQLGKSGAGREGFAVAAAKEATDRHLRLLRGVGIRPAAAYSQAAALAFAAGIPDAVVVYLGLSRASIVLVCKGVPQAVHQVVHQVQFPGEEVSAPNLAQAVAWGVELVAGYYQPLDPREGDVALPVVLTGQVPGDAPLVSALPGVLPFAPPVVYPESFPPGEYAINLGLALADLARARSRGKPSRSGVPAINLLPERYLPRAAPVRPIGVLVALLLLGAVAFDLTPRADNVELEAATLSVRLDGLQRQERLQRLSRLRAQGIEVKARAAVQMASGLESRLEGLHSELQAILARLETLTGRALPPRLQLSSLGLQGDTYILSGTASTYEDIIRYAANLRASGLFAEVVVLRMEASAGGKDAGQVASPRFVSFQARASVASTPSQ